MVNYFLKMTDEMYSTILKYYSIIITAFLGNVISIKRSENVTLVFVVSVLQVCNIIANVRSTDHLQIR